MAKEQVIGVLRLNTEKLKKDIKDVNDILKGLGVGIDLDMSKTITDAIKKQMDAMVKQAKEAGAIVQKNQDLTSKGNQAAEKLAAKYKELATVTKEWAKGADMSATVRQLQEEIHAIEGANASITENVAVVKEKANAEAQLAIQSQRATEAAKKQAEAAMAQARAQAEAAVAARNKEVADAQARVASQAKAEEAAAESERLKKEQQDIQNAINAWNKYYEAITKLRTAERYGNKETQSLYKGKAEEQLEVLRNLNPEIAKNEQVLKAAQAASNKFAKSQQQAAKEAEKMAAADNKAAEAARKKAEASADKQEAQKIKDLTAKYVELYNIEAKLQKFNLGENQVNTLNKRHAALLAIINDEKQFTQEERTAAQQSEKVTKAIQKREDATAQAADAEATYNQRAQSTEQSVSRIVNYLKMIIVMRGLRELWQNAKEYAKQYYDALNEIQVVTLKSESQIDQLTDKYQRMAKQLSVTSTEVANAAVLFYRQGLNDNEVDDRLKATTMFAKTAAIDVSEAAEMITATMNSMNEDIQGNVQRVTDVFLYLGDNAATSADEIATAMQKASATAGTYGMSFEWLASYIATVSETTRQAAEVVGTSFNSIIARLHNIKQKGFNEEDATKINDVAKALANVDIELLKSDGSWRDMSDIFADIAGKWEDMDDKMRSYIATTIAGTRQQNTFIALMNDMSKGIGNGSRVFELYEGAMSATGTTMEKYSIWEESIEAANNRMTASLEKLYKTILSDDAFKGLYNTVTSVVTVFNKGTEALGGFNLILPLVIGGVLSLVRALSKLEASGGFANLFTSHPYAVIAAGVVALIAAMSSIAGAFETAEERLEQANEALDKSQSRIQEYEAMIKTVNTTSANTNLSVEEFVEAIGDIANVSPAAKKAIDDVSDGLISQKEAAAELTDELQNVIDGEREISKYQMMKKLANTTPQMDSSAVADNKLGVLQKYYGLDLTDQDSFYSVMKSLIGDSTNAISKAKRLIKQGPGAVFETRESGLTSAVRDVLKKMELTGSDVAGMDINSDAFKSVADRLFSTIFGSSADAYKEQMIAEVEDAVSEAVDVVFYDLEDYEKGYIKQDLMSAILGTDGELDANEYDTYAEMILKNIYHIEDDVSSVINDYKAKHGMDLIKALFGEGEYLSEAEKYWSDDTARAFVDQYMNMIKAGLSDENIKNILGGMDMIRWMYDPIREALESMLSERFDMSVYSDMINGLSSDILAMIYKSLTDNAENNPDLVFDIVDAFNMFGNSQEFVDALKEMGVYTEEFGEELEDTEEKVYKLSDALGGIGDANSFIKAIQSGDASITDMLKTAKSMADVGVDGYSAIGDFIEGIGADGEIKWSESAARGFAEALVNLAITEEDFGDSTDTIREKLIAMIGVEEEAADASKLLSAALGSISDTSGFLTGIEKGDKSFVDMVKMAQTMADASPDDLYNSWVNFINFENGSFEWNADAAVEYSHQMIDAYLAQEEVMDELGGNVETVREAMYGLVAAEKDVAKETESASEKVNNTISNFSMLTGARDNLSDSGKMSMKDITEILDTYPQLIAYLGDAEELKTKMQELIQQEYGNVKSEFVNYLGGNERLAQDSPFAYLLDAENGIKTLNDVIGKTNGDAYGEVTEYIDGLAESALNAATDIETLNGVVKDDALGELAKSVTETMESNWASSNGYAEQIAAINEAYESGGIDAAVEKFNSFSDGIRDAVAKEFPNLIKSLDDARDAQEDLADGSESATKAENKFGKELKNTQKYLKAKYFKDTAKATKELRDGTISVADAYKEFYDESDNVLKAMEDIADVNDKMANGTEVTASDVSNLEKVLDMSANDILANWDNVQEEMNAITSASGEAMSALDALNEAAFVRITGTSDVDFSDLQRGLVTTQGMAKDVIDMLVATGQFEVQTVPLNQESWVWENGVAVKKKNTGMFQIIKPTGKNPFKSGSTTTTNKGGKGGGGGGGGSSKKGMTEVERMLDRQSQFNDIRGSAKSFYEAQAGYNEQNGMIQGVIKYYELQREKLEDMNGALDTYLESVEEYMVIKRAELATLQNGTEEYEEVADDLEKLQKAHQDYTQQIIENKTEIDELTESIKEQRDAIRQMEIDLRELVYSAIEDRNQKMEDMLDAEVDMENEILDIIRERYEKERDLTLELADQRIDALEEEKSLIQEELDLRREQAEEEDKLAKLNELEAKYARISADPTRKKEALEIQKEINELRDEMAWDTAEKEVEAQQKAIDEQIESIEDYKTYVEDYYEDLFAHPQKLIDEMESIISRTDQEIIDWLAENNEEYAAATENAKQIMVNGWQDTLDTMRGQIRAYWDEVEQIIAGGDDAIISFLMENSADYAAAGKLQAEAYVDEWKKQLEDLHKAYMNVEAELAPDNYEYIAPYEESGSSKSGGGSSSKKGGSSNKTTKNSTSSGKNLIGVAGSKLSAVGTSSSSIATPSVVSSVTSAVANALNSIKLTKYAGGGIADQTGPVWVDGTPGRPEGIMNPQQFEVWQRMVSVLEQIPRISVSGMPNLGQFDTGNAQSFNIENITVNVGNLNTDDDYDELASKVGEALMDKMSRGVVVGGIRTGR